MPQYPSFRVILSNTAEYHLQLPFLPAHVFYGSHRPSTLTYFPPVFALSQGTQFRWTPTDQPKGTPARNPGRFPEVLLSLSVSGYFLVLQQNISCSLLFQVSCASHTPCPQGLSPQTLSFVSCHRFGRQPLFSSRPCLPDQAAYFDYSICYRLIPSAATEQNLQFPFSLPTSPEHPTVHLLLVSLSPLITVTQLSTQQPLLLKCRIYLAKHSWVGCLQIFSTFPVP